MKKGKVVLLTAVGVLVITVGAPLVAILIGGSGKPAEAPDAVIVLGFQLDEGGKPADVLAARCEAAADYLLAHPDVVCVATGGKTADAPFSEAEVIRDLLVARGVEAERILLEPDAANTGENMAFSAALLKERGIGGRVVIVTDGFHQYRAAYFARKNGLEPSPLCCETAPATAFTYTCREMLAVYKAWVLGK